MFHGALAGGRYRKLRHTCGRVGAGCGDAGAQGFDRSAQRGERGCGCRRHAWRMTWRLVLFIVAAWLASELL